MPIKNSPISEKVMLEIKEKHILMRPRWYFVLGSLLSWLGLVISMILSVYVLSLYHFAFRARSPMAQYKVGMILSDFPLWLPITGLVSIIAGVYLLRKYDFSYKKNFIVIILGFIASIVVASMLVDWIGLNDIWAKRGPMRNFYRQQELQKNPQHGTSNRLHIIPYSNINSYNSYPYKNTR